MNTSLHSPGSLAKGGADLQAASPGMSLDPECAGGLDIVRGMQSRARADRIPLSGSLALTHRCNLRCVHCYASTPTAAPELGTARLLDIIDEIADAGCLFLLVTGGEPLVRPDFRRIYTRIKEKGILVNLFTNGTLINDETLGLLRELPPRVVDITLYGSTETTYRSVTGVPGMAAKAYTAVERLLEIGINVTVKTVVMSLNQHEFHNVEEQAKAWGIQFRLDAALFPRFDGDRVPLQYRLAPEAAAALEFSDSKRAGQWQAFYDRTGAVPRGEALYQCAAGVRSFHIDPAGHLQPCLMAKHLCHSLETTSFRKGWDRLSADMASRKKASNSPCASCRLSVLCGYCPPFSLLEMGNESARNDFLCLLGKARLSNIEAIQLRKDGCRAGQG